MTETAPLQTPLIESARHGDVHEIHLARPPVNALNPVLCRALRDAVESAPGNGAKAIVLSGGPGVFSAGLDVPFLLTLERPALTEAWGAFFAAVRALAQCPVPVAAAIAGHSPAGGCVLALACDYRVMARGPYRIGLNEVQVGLVVPEGIQRMLRRVIGAYRAERLMVVGAMVEAEQALAVGLVDELVELEQVTARAVAWAQSLFALPHAALLATRRLARADLVEAVSDPAAINLDGFLDEWYAPRTQAALQAMVARLKAKG